MAIITVDPGGGGDHTTIAAAVAAAGSTDTVRLIANVTETVGLGKNIAGFDSDGTIALGTARTWDGTGSGGSHTLAYSTGITQRVFVRDLIMDHSSGGADTTKINGKSSGFGLDYSRVQLKHSSASGSGFLLSDVSGTGVLDEIMVDRVDFHGGASDRGIHVNSTTTADYMTVTNCQFHELEIGISIPANTTNNLVNVFHCTFHDNTVGVETNSRMTVTNCLFLNASQDDVNILGSASAADFTNCGFQEQGSPFGSNNTFSLVEANEIVNPATHDVHLLDSATAKGLAVVLSPVVVVGYDGELRPINLPDLGCFENQNAQKTFAGIT